MDAHGPDGLQTPTFDDIGRLLDAVNALHAASPPRRADVLAAGLAAALRADAATVGHVGPDGTVVRLAAAGSPPPGPGAAIEAPSAGGPAAVSAVGPAGGASVVRSVCHRDGVVSVLEAWRGRPFGGRHAGLLAALHPAVAWAVAPAMPAPAGVAGQVLELMLVGLAEKEIARRLGRSAHTVHGHVKRVYRHYGVRSRSELIVTQLGRADRGVA